MRKGVKGQVARKVARLRGKSETKGVERQVARKVIKGVKKQVAKLRGSVDK